MTQICFTFKFSVYCIAIHSSWIEILAPILTLSRYLPSDGSHDLSPVSLGSRSDKAKHRPLLHTQDLPCKEPSHSTSDEWYEQLPTT